MNRIREILQMSNLALETLTQKRIVSALESDAALRSLLN